MSDALCFVYARAPARPATKHPALRLRGGRRTRFRFLCSFFATLECELLDRVIFKTQAEARMAVFDFIEGFYNPHRRHSSIDYLSPMDYERRYYSTPRSESSQPSTEAG